MLLCLTLLCIFCVLNSIVQLPTKDTLKENLPDLIPVSSTVIPLPNYQVGYGLNVSHGIKYPKLSHYDSSKLITDETKKKYYYGEKKQQFGDNKKTN